MPLKGESDRDGYVFICDEAALKSVPPTDFQQISVIFVNPSLNWHGSLLQHNYGLDIAMTLRRDYLAKCPIIFSSVLDRKYFENRQLSDSRYKFLDASGTGFFSFPLSVDFLKRQVHQTKALSETSHREVVIEYCGLQKQWNYISHRLREIVNAGREGCKEAKDLLEGWAPVIYHYYPQSTQSFEELRRLVMTDRAGIQQRSLTSALERLNLELKYGTATDSASKRNQHRSKLAIKVSPSPPTGYSKILIADDKPSPLVETLSDKYHYEVLRPQSFNYSDAKRRLLSDLPHVVLADYYFPKEESGRMFLIDAVSRPRSSGLKAVLCVSSQEFRDDELPEGVVNCSSMTEAHNGDFIHRRIWELAGDAEPLQIDRGPNPERRITNYSNRLAMYCARWRNLPTQVNTILSALIVLSESASGAEQRLINDVTRTLENSKSATGHSLSEALDFLDSIAIVQAAVRRMPETEILKGLRSLLHDLQNNSVLRDIEATLRELSEDLTFLKKIPHIGQVAKLLGDLDELRKVRDLTLTDLEGLKNGLRKTQPAVTSLQLPSVESNTQTRYRIVIVEDDEIWRGFAVSAVKEVTDQLSGGGYSIGCESYANATEARKALPVRKRFRNGTSEDSVSPSNTIVVVDLHLPKDRNQAKRIRRGVETARRENGINLIKYLRSYNSQYPVIVFSNSRTVGDSKLLRGLGIPGEDHLLKQGESDALVKALVRKIRSKQVHTVELVELSIDDKLDADSTEINIQGFFRVDGVAIPLTESEKRILYAICVDDIESLSQIKNLPDRKYRIQRKISEELNKAGRYVGPDEIIKPIVGIKGGYSLAASFIAGDRVKLTTEELDWLAESDLGEDSKNIARCKVLVVENDKITNDYLRRELSRLGFEVHVASDVGQAVKTARLCKPDILLLDLQLPSVSVETLDRSHLSDAGGLDVLEQVRVFQHDIRAVSFTGINVNDNPQLISRAESLGLWIDDIVAKHEVPDNSGTPESLLFTKIENVRTEILRDPDFIARCLNKPTIEILLGSKFETGKLRLKINGRDYETGRTSPLERILGFLILNPNRLVRLSEISDALKIDIPKDLGKKWAERLRERIRNEWLRLPPTEANEPEKQILENYPQSQGGMRLNVRVIGLESMNAGVRKSGER